MFKKSQLTDRFFYLLVFALPLQLRHVFARPEGSLGNMGPLFNEWLSISLFVTDLVLITFLVLHYWQSGWPHFSRKDYLLGVFLVYALASLFIAEDFWLSLSRALLLLLWVGFGLAATSYWQDTKQRLIALRVLGISGVVQAIIAIGQNWLQADLGLRWLGETVLRSNLNGVAVVPLESGDLLRSYGVLPHPNILAVFLLAALWAWLYLILNPATSEVPQKKRSLFLRNFGYLALPLIFYAWLATFARGVIGVGLLTGLLAVWFARFKFWKVAVGRRILAVTLLAGIIFLIFNWSAALARVTLSPDEQAVSMRLTYNQIGANALRQAPWLGVGVGSFVAWLQTHQPDLPLWAYQPVHNLYLLIATEIGLIGGCALIAWLAWLLYALRQRLFWQLLPLIAFMLIGLFDHFFWTSRQGGLLFWLVIGWSRAGKESFNI